MLGGSGLNFYGGDASNKAIVRRNIIAGNLWGITTQQVFDLDLGSAADPGGNVFTLTKMADRLMLLHNMPKRLVHWHYWGTMM